MAIKGTTITLYDRVQVGKDPFNAPVFQETAVEVENVLICPASSADIVTDLQLYGKRAEYELCIPKGDTHIWEDRTVEFYGQKWQTFGIPLTWMQENTPGQWSQKVKVERYG